MALRFEVGTVILCNDVKGVVVENVKLPGDICVKWETMDEIVSYDEDWLNDNVKIE